MQPEIVTFAGKHLPLVYGFAAGTLFGMAVEWLAAVGRRRRWRERNRRRWGDESRANNVADGPWCAKSDPVVSKPTDAADQLRIVMAADFSVQPLLNKKEARVFRELEKIVIARNPCWQVMAQVSLGEILRCKDAMAYSCINSKRVDLLLVDDDCKPRHAIEYQGVAHYQGTAAARDAVKKEALRRAEIGYHEVVAGHTTPSDLRRLVERLVEKPAAS
jgi:uncharacterized protein DUF2726